MNEYQLKNGWKILAKTARFLVLEDELGHVGITYYNKQFGDSQVLLLKFTEQGVDVKTLPHYVEKVSVNFNKTIIVDVAAFVESYEQE